MVSIKNGVVKKTITYFKSSNSILQTFFVFAGMFILMSIFVPRFATPINQVNILKQLSVNLIVAAGMTFIILTGEFDISVGSVVALTGAVAGKIMLVYGVLPAVLVAMLIGPAFGVLHGLIVTKGKIPSFITTLGTQMIARSLAFVVTEGKVVSGIPPSFKVLGQGDIGGVPLNIMPVIVVYLISFLILMKTPFGKKIYAVGANRSAAVLSGIKADVIKIQNFVIVGFLASLGGLMMLSRMGATQAYSAKGMEFDCIAAVVIGGTSLTGGEGHILQTIIGVFIIGIIRNALNLSQIDIFWQDFATGAIIIVAVLIDSVRKQLMARRN